MTSYLEKKLLFVGLAFYKKKYLTQPREQSWPSRQGTEHFLKFNV